MSRRAQRSDSMATDVQRGGMVVMISIRCARGDTLRRIPRLPAQPSHRPDHAANQDGYGKNQHGALQAGRFGHRDLLRRWCRDAGEHQRLPCVGERADDVRRGDIAEDVDHQDGECHCRGALAGGDVVDDRRVDRTGRCEDQEFRGDESAEVEMRIRRGECDVGARCREQRGDSRDEQVGVAACLRK